MREHAWIVKDKMLVLQSAEKLHSVDQSFVNKWFSLATESYYDHCYNSHIEKHKEKILPNLSNKLKNTINLKYNGLHAFNSP